MGLHGGGLTNEGVYALGKFVWWCSLHSQIDYNGWFYASPAAAAHQRPFGLTDIAVPLVTWPAPGCVVCSSVRTGHNRLPRRHSSIYGGVTTIRSIPAHQQRLSGSDLRIGLFRHRPRVAPKCPGGRRGRASGSNESTSVACRRGRLMAPPAFEVGGSDYQVPCSFGSVNVWAFDFVY